MPVPRHFHPIIAFASGVISLSPLAFGQPSFQGLGDLPGDTTYSYAWDVSANGAVAVGASGSGPFSGGESFRWEAGALTGLGGPSTGSVGNFAYGVSADGAVIVGANFTTETVTEAYRWTAVDGMVGLGDLPGGDDHSEALAVSDDGNVIVGRSASEASELWAEAFRWEGGVMTGLGFLNGNNSSGEDVSADGSVVVGYDELSSSQREAFRWENGVMVGLGDLPGGGFYSHAYGVSGDGRIVIGEGTSALGNEAFRWENGVMVGLGDLPGGIFQSTVRAVSADGLTIVGIGRTDLGGEAFIWDETNGMRNLREVLVNDYGLDLTGWTLVQATGVSANGLVIVGFGIHDGNPNPEGWRAEITFPDCNDNSVPDFEEVDSDGDGFIDDCDTCTLYANPDQSSRPRADVDEDCDVDGVDFGVFASCFNGAGKPPRTAGCPPENATAFDFLADGDVDGVDFTLFASCFNGAGNPPRTENCPLN